MNIYLVDYENVQSQGLVGILNLSAQDSVYVFYSAKDKLSFEILEQITKSKSAIKYLKSSVGGKNALDHQISGYLGYLLGTSECKEYYIVSKDKGYQHIMEFWQEQKINVNIHTISSIKEAKTITKEVTKKIPTKAKATKTATAVAKAPSITKKPMVPKPKITTTKTVRITPKNQEVKEEHRHISVDEITKIIPETDSKDWVNDIVRFMNNAENKAQLYQQIRRRLGQDKGSKIYNAVKKLY
ncbi:MAG: PIN domain-containing protein [Clostridiales bacterium]